jgi:hypothetical protein
MPEDDGQAPRIQPLEASKLHGCGGGVAEHDRQKSDANPELARRAKRDRRERWTARKEAVLNDPEGVKAEVLNLAGNPWQIFWGPFRPKRHA